MAALSPLVSVVRIGAGTAGVLYSLYRSGAVKKQVAKERDQPIVIDPIVYDTQWLRYWRNHKSYRPPRAVDFGLQQPVTEPAAAASASAGH